MRCFLALVLAASLGTNVWLAFQLRHDGTRSPAVRPEPKPVVPKSHDAGLAATEPAPAIGRPGTAADLRALTRRLEAAGLPPDIVRNVLAAAIHRSFQQRREALLGQPGPDEYWRNPGRRLEPADQDALRELDREQRRLLREFSEPGPFPDEAAERRQFGGLPEAKVAQLKKILVDYVDLEEQTFADVNERGTADGRARLALLAKEKRADIERLLTPEELLAYDLRNSPAAHRLRNRLGQFDATEAEFRALYPLYQATITAENQPGRSPATAEPRRAREAAEQQLDAELRRVLGEKRYAEMKDANDGALQETRAFVRSQNLPPSAGAEILAIQREIFPRLSAVERDRDLTPNQRDAQLFALASEARDGLTRILGPQGFELYKRRGGGWLGAALSRAPPTPPPTQ